MAWVGWWILTSRVVYGAGCISRYLSISDAQPLYRRLHVLRVRATPGRRSLQTRSKQCRAIVALEASMEVRFRKVLMGGGWGKGVFRIHVYNI